jgi:predicted phosphodiesterase
VRTVLQLGAVIVLVVFIVLILDSQLRVLPAAIHNHLPTHRSGFVVTDVTVTTCSPLNIFSSCDLDPKTWHRVEKELHLGKSWTSKAYLQVQTKKSDEIMATDKVVVDLKMGRLNPGAGSDNKWESRPGGIWLLRATGHHSVDSHKPLTGVDVLFGPDAADPRPNWELKDTPLRLDPDIDARVSFRRGGSGKIERPTPRIRKDGKFKIMQAADLHLSTGIGHCREPVPESVDGKGCEADPRTIAFLERLLDEEKPDLVVLTGDQVNGETAPDSQTAIFKFADIFIRRQIPFAAIFGNHDDEGSLSRSGSMTLMEDLPYSLAQPGPVEVDGVGNYVVEVLDRGSSSHSALTLYLLDSHAYSPDDKKYKGYDWIKQNQIDWFKSTSTALAAAHVTYTHIHMNLAFIHIPLPEYGNRKNYFAGNWSEPPTAPKFNSHFRDALISQKVVLVSCGQ